MSIDIKVGVVIVSYGHQAIVEKLVNVVRSQLSGSDKLVVVDNHPDKLTYELLRDIPDVTVIKQDNNGFSAGCNVGAAAILDAVDVLFFLNPDTLPEPGVVDAVKQVDWGVFAACMPLLVLPDGRINSAGNVVHTTGLSWCDKIYQNAEVGSSIQEVNVLSGACAAISVEWWAKLGGMDEKYFMYYEDTDLSTRLRLLGGRIALLNHAKVSHDYEFSKGSYKWFYIERNMPLYMIKNWPLSVLILLSPQNLVIGIGLWAVALMQKRFVLKIRSTIDFFKVLPDFLRARHVVQQQRQLSSLQFMQTLHPQIDTPLLKGPLSNKLINGIFDAYYRFAKGVLGLFTYDQKKEQ